jgi:hypothetical protein
VQVLQDGGERAPKEGGDGVEGDVRLMMRSCAW